MHGYLNKEVSQVKRRIINIYLSMQDLKEAVDELEELKNIDSSIYGKYSNIVAKNYKLRGILELAFCNSDNSIKFLGKSYKIFQKNNKKSHIYDINEKINKINKYNDYLVKIKFLYNENKINDFYESLCFKLNTDRNSINTEHMLNDE